MTRRTHQTTKRRSPSSLTKALVLLAIGSAVLSACADSPATTTATTSAGASGSAAPATLSVSDTGTFKGLVTSSDVITPTVDGKGTIVLVSLAANDVSSATAVGTKWVKAHASVRKGKTVITVDGEKRKLPRADRARLARGLRAS